MESSERINHHCPRAHFPAADETAFDIGVVLRKLFRCSCVRCRKDKQAAWRAWPAQRTTKNERTSRRGMSEMCRA